MKQFRIYRTDEETFAILYCRTPYILTLRVNLLSQMNPLAELLQCDSRLIRYAWDSRLALKWAMQPADAQPATWGGRLTSVRGFGLAFI
jgi:hypothetical protein